MNVDDILDADSDDDIELDGSLGMSLEDILMEDDDDMLLDDAASSERLAEGADGDGGGAGSGHRPAAAGTALPTILSETDVDGDGSDDSDLDVDHIIGEVEGVLPSGVGRSGGGRGSDGMRGSSAEELMRSMLEEEDVSPLAMAEAYERRLLATGSTSITSPLKVKRRLRTRAATSSGTEEAMEGAGVGKVDRMDKISRQLTKNAKYMHRGPGLPTAIAIHDKYIAIGTSRNLIMVFDHFQEVRVVLGDPDDGDGNGAVTSLDVSPTSDWLAAGYLSGRIIVWDIMKGTAVKTLKDAHKSPLTTVRFHASAGLVSTDTLGVVNVISLTRMLMVYVADTQCLLDGSAGQVVALSVLSMNPSAHALNAFNLVGLSSYTSTFVLALKPEPKVLHKWARPEDALEGTLCCLDWQWAELKGRDSPTAVLARGWGQLVQLCAVEPGVPLPSFTPLLEVRPTNPVTAIAWLTPRMLVLLDTEYSMCMYDSVVESEVDLLDVSALKLVYATFSRESIAGDGDDGDIHMMAALSFQSSVRACAGNLYLLGLGELRSVRVQSWSERIDSLIERGEWMDALVLALEQYGQTADGKRALVGERITRLLTRYVDLAIEFSPSEHLHLQHYRMLGSVCIDFCVEVSRTDVLFGDLLAKFRAVKQHSVFLELLEPYILSDELRYLDGPTMRAFIEHYKECDRLPQVEQCLLHMDVARLDLDVLLPLCHDNLLFSALIYLYNKGRDDYVSPVRILLAALPRGRETFGYKLILYLSYCLSGRAFPRGDIPAERLPTLRRDVVSALLLRDGDVGGGSGGDGGGDGDGDGDGEGSQLPMEPLLQLDAHETLNVFVQLFDAPDAQFEGEEAAVAAADEEAGEKEAGEKGGDGEQQDTACIMSRQRIIDLLAASSAGDHAAFYSFAARFVGSGAVRLPTEQLKKLVSFLCSSDRLPAERKEQMLVALLQRELPRGELDAVELVSDVERAGLYRAAVLLHRESGNVKAAINCYLAESQEVYRNQLFSYLSDTLSHAPPGQFDRLASLALERFADLVAADSRESALLVMRWFADDHASILKRLDGDARLKFDYLRQIIKLSSRKGGFSSSPSIDVTSDMHIDYLRLLCQFQPDNVFNHLSSHDNYPLDECLRLCQEFEITDATSYLLERTGNVQGALALIQQELSAELTSLPKVLLADGKAKVEQLLQLSMALCQRHTPLSSHGAHERDPQSEKLWFALLETLVTAQRDLSRSAPRRVKEALGTFVRTLLQQMIQHVALVGILEKITSDFHRDELGYFRTTLLGMLDTYGYEQSILRAANHLLAVDLFKHVRNLRGRQRAAFAAHSGICALCGRPLDGPAPGKRAGRRGGMIAVYACGHSFHESCASKQASCTLCKEAEVRRRRGAAVRIPAVDATRKALAAAIAEEESGSSGDGDARSGDDSASKEDEAAARRAASREAKLYLRRLKSAAKRTRTRPTAVTFERLARPDSLLSEGLRPLRPPTSGGSSSRIGMRDPGVMDEEPKYESEVDIGMEELLM